MGATGDHGAPVDARNRGRGGLRWRRDASRRSAAEENSGGGASVRDWREERVGELREGEAVPARGSERAEERR